MQKKSVIKLFSYTILIMLFLGSCIDEVDFNAPREGGQLVVDGRMTNSFGPQTVKLFRINEVGRSTGPVTGAELFIGDDIGFREQFVETEAGVYVLEGNQVKGEKGRTYTLEILLADGTEYRSFPETLPSAEMEQDSAYFELVTETVLGEAEVPIDVLKARISIDSRIPAEPIYLKWELVHVFVRLTPNPNPAIPSQESCYLTRYPNPQEFLLHDGGRFESLSLEKFIVGSKIVDEDFFYISALNVVRSSVDREAFEYWERVDQVINSVGTIFDVPGATVPGNIFNVDNPNEQVLGYFEAVARDTSRVILSRVDFPAGKVLDPCSGALFQKNRETCRPCINIPIGTLKKPSYWPN